MTTAGYPSSEPPSVPQIHLLLQALHTYLPYSLPLYRRFQFHLSHPNPPFAQVFNSFSPLSPLSKERLSAERWLLLACKQEQDAEQVPWICSHIDLSAAGQTQVWVFANWELPRIQKQQATLQTLNERGRLLQALFEKIYDRDVPLIPETGPKGLLQAKKVGREDVPFSRTKVLFGALNVCVRSLIPEGTGERLDGGTVHYLFPQEKVIMRAYDPYLKYLFPTKSSCEPREEQNGTEPHTTLPPDYTFGPMQYQYLQMVLDRTDIPRGLDTMSSFFGIGLFYKQDPTPVGWGFLGKDASLTSLHTEPEHRGKGLAVLLSKELFRRQNEHFRTIGDKDAQAEVDWAHADVAEYNLASRKVMEKIGGTVEWEDCWIDVELESLVGKTGVWRALDKQ